MLAYSQCGSSRLFTRPALNENCVYHVGVGLMHSVTTACPVNDGSKSAPHGEQDQLTIVQTYMLRILSSKGRRAVTAIVREGRTCNPPGMERLKDIVMNFKSLTGSDKWLLGSLMLLVFRPALVSVDSMVSPSGECSILKVSA